eukprot:328221-Prymnesium_polylepis.1
MSTGVPGGILYWPSSKPTEKNWPAGSGLSRLNSVRTPSAVAISAAVFTESPSSAHRVTFTRAIFPPDETIREPPAAFMEPELSTIHMRSGKACADACIVWSSPGGNDLDVHRRHHRSGHHSDRRGHHSDRRRSHTTSDDRRTYRHDRRLGRAAADNRNTKIHDARRKAARNQDAAHKF